MDPVIADPTVPGSRSARLPAQRWAEANLAAHPHDLELRGSTDSVAWPNLCANCGGGANELIEVRKIFRRRPRRRSSGLRDHKTTIARIPFCAQCAQQHRAMEVRTSVTPRIFGALFHPLIIPVAGSAFILTKVLPEALPLSPFATDGRVAWALTAVLTFACLWSLFLLWRVAIRRGVPPQTEITLACDFSEDVSQLFEGERHIYRMRNAAFAQGLATLNRDRVWTEQHQAGSRRRMHVTAIAGLAIIVLIWVTMYIFRW